MLINSLLVTLFSFNLIGNGCGCEKVCKIIDRLRPYHVTIITNRSTVARDRENCWCKTPAILTDLRDMKVFNDNHSLLSPLFKKPRRTTIYMVLVKKNGKFHLNEVFDILNDLAKISPIQQRPKSLLILLDEWSDDEVKKVLRYAWFLKFLDFSIVKSELENSTGFINYNPFFKSFFKSSVEAFPDKLNDVKKYPLIIPGFHAPPYLAIDSNNKTNGIWFDYIEVVMKKLNFERQFVMVTNNSVRQMFENIFKKLEKNEASVTPITFYSWRFINRDLIMGDFFEFDLLSILAPLIKTSKVHFSFAILLDILSFPVIILILFSLTKFLKFNVKRWNVLYIFRILIGHPSSSPHRKSEKILYLLTAILSIIYSNLFFDKFADMRFVEKELELNSIEQIYESKMKIYSIYFALKFDPPEIRDLFSKTEQVDKDRDCISKVIDTRSSMCILPFDFAKYSVKRNVDSKDKPIMKFLKYLVRHESRHLGYEKASPFAEKFDKIIQMIRESGIWKQQKISEIFSRHEEKNSAIVEDILIYQLLLISFFGWFFAIVLFICEMIRRPCRKKIKLRGKFERRYNFTM